MNKIIKISLMVSILAVLSGCGVRELNEYEAVGTYTCIGTTIFGASNNKDKFKYTIKSNHSFIRIASNGYKTTGNWEIEHRNNIYLTDIGESKPSDKIRYDNYDKPTIIQTFDLDLDFGKRDCVKQN